MAACPGSATCTFGLPHTGLGGAEMFFGPNNELLVFNFGSEGDDGVSIALGDAGGWRGTMLFGEAGALAAKASVTVGMSAAIDGQVVELALGIDEVDGGSAAISFDAGAVCDPCTLVVEARLDGKVVDAVTHQAPFPAELARGDFGSSGGAGVEIGYRLTRLAAPQEGASDMECEVVNSIATAVTLFGSPTGPVDADTVVLKLEGLPDGVPASSAITIIAANIVEIAISDEALVQFRDEHRAFGLVTMSGDLDANGLHDFVFNFDDAFDPFGASVRPFAGDLDGDGFRDAAVGVSIETAQPQQPLEWGWTTFGRLEDGSLVTLLNSYYAITVSGGRGVYIPDQAWLGDREITVTARLDGVITAQGVMPHDGRAVGGIGEGLMPDSARFDLVETDDPSMGSFRLTLGYENDVTAMSQAFVGVHPADELEFEVTGPLTGARAVEVTEFTTLYDHFLHGGPGELRIESDAFLVAPAPCPADLDDSDDVNIFDLLALIGSWGPCPPGPGRTGCAADLDGDGVVNVVDLLALIGEWG
ncbi:MAG: dockerin type I domain-containing protein, partial [Phycisphaerales bacterium]|nr:dockerin type I domain-containing protein [Phycisphaerales bacterium]